MKCVAQEAETSGGLGDWDYAASLISDDPDDLDLHYATAEIATVTVVGAGLSRGLWPALALFARSYDVATSERHRNRQSRRGFKKGLRAWSPEGASAGATFLTIGFLRLLCGLQRVDPETRKQFESLQSLISLKLGHLLTRSNFEFIDELETRLNSLTPDFEAPLLPAKEDLDTLTSEEREEVALQSQTRREYLDTVAGLYLLALGMAVGPALGSLPAIEESGGLDLDYLMSGRIPSIGWMLISGTALPELSDELIHYLSESAARSASLLP